MSWRDKLRHAWKMFRYQPPVRVSCVNDDDSFKGEVRQAQQKFRSAAALVSRAARENSSMAREAHASLKEVIAKRRQEEEDDTLNILVFGMRGDKKDH
jgi:hypothetical protein